MCQQSDEIQFVLHFPKGTCHSDHDKFMEVLGKLPLTAHKMPLKLKMRGKNAPGNQGCPSLNVNM